MKFRKKFIRNTVLTISALALVGCSSNATTESQNINQNVEQTSNSDLTFNQDDYTVETIQVGDETINYRAFKGIVYVTNPKDIEYQTMNLFVPEAYFEGSSIGNYTIDTAPILLTNNSNDYMPAKASDLQENINSNSENENLEYDAMVEALSRGHIVASVGVRGITNQDENGVYTGKAPSSIIDLKAAARYLHYNDEIMPGDSNKIISNGTNSAGALAALLGTSADIPEYEKYLTELGAAPANDKIFAVSTFSPKTNLENLDIAYEWVFNGINEYTKIIKEEINGEINEREEYGTLTESEINTSNELKSLFPQYVNSLNLVDSNGQELKLDENGEGTFKDYIKQYVIKSAQKALDKGEDLSEYNWLTINNTTVEDINFEEYVKYVGREKTPLGFDSIDLSSVENKLFGNDKVDAQHFTDFSLKNDTNSTESADPEVIKMMNPLSYISSNSDNAAKYWRIRQGTKDSSTPLPVPVILSTLLENNGYNVNFELDWEESDYSDYSIDELFNWIDEISSSQT